MVSQKDYAGMDLRNIQYQMAKVILETLKFKSSFSHLPTCSLSTVPYSILCSTFVSGSF